MSKLNVLSVDFDYFQKVDRDTLGYYPDGHDFGTEMSKFIWAGHYANPIESKEILKVEVDTDKIDFIKRVISDVYDIGTRTMICNSHRYAYDFINMVYEEEGFDEGVDIYNVDMHHDLFNNNPKVDCGNWISHVLDDIPNSTVTWIANPISKEAYGMDSDRFYMVSENLEDIEYIDFDAIFLCRSDIWTPPHLDSYFKDLSYYIIELNKDMGNGQLFLEEKVLEERNCTEEINQLKKAYKDLCKKEVH